MAQKFTVPVTIKNLSSAGSDGLTVFLDQESFARLKVEAGGRITWGAGSGAGDTNLYRDAESVLKTDDTFKAAGLYVAGTQIDPTGATVGDALIFNGTKFVSASVADGGATLTVSDTAPEDPSLGDLWFNSTDLEIYVYYSSSWIQVTDSSPGVQELYELVDVLIDDPVSGETLVYNGTEWVNEIAPAGIALSLETARAISISGDASGSVLFDGSQDVNITASVRFISGTEIDPSGATVGDALVFNGTKFVSASVAGGGGASLTVSDTPPPGASEGDLWFRSDTANTYVYYDSSWVEIGASGGVATLDDIGNVSASAPASGDFLKWNGSAWVNDSIDLGSETNGIYVADLVAGTGVTITNGASESASPTIAIGQSVGTTASVTFSNVTADLVGNVTGNLTGDVTGNADTATSLETSRTIALSGDVSGSVSFDGSASVSIATTIQPNSVALGTDTTGNYMSDVTQGTGVTITHTPGEGSNATIAIGQTVGTSSSVTFANVTADLVGDVTGNADTATALQTARTIELSGDVSGSALFDGTSNINLFTTVNTASVAIDELYGVDISNPEEFQTLQYNGTEWANQYASVVTYVRNAEATTLTTGTAVYLFGATGDHASVKRADNDSDTTSSKTVGLVAANIAAAENGPVVTRGYVDGINLSVGYTPGDVLWLGENGAFTKTKPSAPEHLVFIGVVVRATNNGIVYVATQNGYELDELHDVKINGVTDGQFLRYNSASTVWVNDTINLGTDTAGDYVQSLVAGTGVTLSNNSGETATPTVAIGQDVATSASVTFAHLIVQGDMEVQGTITRLNETNLDVESAFIYLNANSASANPDMGIAFNYDDGTYRHAGLFRDSSDGIFKVFEGYEPEPVSPINTSDATYSDARFQAESLILTQTTGIAPMSVSSSTVVNNLNADKLDGQDGLYYAPIDSPTFTGTVSLPNNTVALGTQTTGNYVADVSGGTGVTVTHTPGEGTTPSIAIGQDVGSSSSVTFAAVTAPLIGNVTGNASTVTNGVYTTSSINALVDVDTVSSSPTSGQFLKWNGTNWVPDSVPTINALDDIGDVSASAPSDGNFLKYVSASSAWVPATIPTINALDDIGDVSVASPTVGHYLQWSGSVWTSASASGGSTVTASTTPPSSPESGSIWFDSSTAKTYVYYDSFWVEIGGTSGGAKMYVDQTAPTSPLEGQLWFKSDTAQTFAYYDSFWIEVGAAGMAAIAADTAPASPVTGQIWFDTDSGATYVYYDSYWIEVGAVAANTIFNLVDAKGDILVGTADNVLARQAVGTDGQLLQANSAETTGLQWFTPTYAPSASPTFTGTVVLPSTTSIGTVTSTEIGYVDGVTSAIQTQLDSKAPLAGPTFTGTVVLPSTTSIGTITSTELGYVDGVTSAIQTQLNAKAPIASPTFTGTVVLPATSAGGAINPSATNTYDLGTASLRWRNIYTQDLHLSNGVGDYTVIEGEENLYLVNNKTNKSFKFALIEVDSSEVPKASDV